MDANYFFGLGLAAAASFRMSLLIEASNLRVGTFSKSFFLPLSILAIPQTAHFKFQDEWQRATFIAFEQPKKLSKFGSFLSPVSKPNLLTIGTNPRYIRGFLLQRANRFGMAFRTLIFNRRNIFKLDGSPCFDSHFGVSL